MTTLRSTLRARVLAPAATALIASIAIATFGGCFVSFDDYRLGDSGAAGRLTQASVGGRAGSPIGGEGGASGGRSNGGRAGADLEQAGDGGQPDAPTAGMPSASAGVGGSLASGGSGGAAMGTGGTTAGTGGALTSGGSSGAGPGSGGTTSAGSGGSAHYTCPTVHGRISVEIPRAGSPNVYCIDRGEVKNAEYQAFLDAGVSTSGQSAACAFNSNYGPDTAGSCTQYDPVGKANLPVACVDWCDAAAYCKWEGKRLCGRIDGAGSNPPASFADASKSAWYRACSHAGDFDLPYGNVYNGERCVGLDNISVFPVAVPHTDCEGGYSGLYDMSGNVSEWEDSCAADTGATDQCLTRGGSYLDTNKTVGSAPSLLCNSNTHGNPMAATKPRSTRDKEIGFRCCGDPISSP